MIAPGRGEAGCLVRPAPERYRFRRLAEVVVALATTQVRRFSDAFKQVCTVLPEGQQLAVPSALIASNGSVNDDFCNDQGLRDEMIQQVKNIPFVELAETANLLHGLDIEAGRKDCKPGPQQLLVPRAEFIAPIDERPQRLLPRNRCPASAREDIETPVQPFHKLNNR